MGELNCLRCAYRHEDNGNCTAVGGFCTAVPAAHCRLLQEYLDTGLTPEEVPTAVEMAQIYSIIEENKRYRALNVTVDRLRELAKADKEGRVVVLPYDAKDAVYGGYISDVKGTYLEVAKELLAEQVAQCVKLAMLDKDMFVVDGVLNIHPCCVDTESKYSLCGEDKCSQCCREFWMQKIE